MSAVRRVSTQPCSITIYQKPTPAPHYYVNELTYPAPTEPSHRSDEVKWIRMLLLCRRQQEEIVLLGRQQQRRRRLQRTKFTKR
jgi:hypothetical protein